MPTAINLPSGSGAAYIITEEFNFNKSKGLQFVRIRTTYRKQEVTVTGYFERLDDYQTSWHRFSIQRWNGLRPGPKHRLFHELSRELRRHVSTELRRLGYVYDDLADVWEAPLVVWKQALTEVDV